MIKITIRNMRTKDWPAVRAIYQEGIDTGIATFETHVPDWNEWNQYHLQVCRFTAIHMEKIVGWAALSPISHRQVYAGVAEISIYIASAAQGRGIGSELLQNLIRESEKAGFWTLQSTIFSENQASIRMHKACGFRVVGTRERAASRNHVWHDTVLLERRSKTVGID